MTLRYLSPTNGFMPEATGQVIAHVRKPEKFRINQYVQYIETPKVLGVYAQLGRDAFVRVVTDEESAWEDGGERPRGEHNSIPFQWVEFRTFRRDYPWALGWQTIEQAGGGWKPKAVHAAMVASQAMTNRTNRLITTLETVSAWGAHTATANVLNGGAGKWKTASDDPNSPFYLAIAKSILEVARRIDLATNGQVSLDDLRLLISPAAAIDMAQSAEMRNYVKGTEMVKQNVTGDVGNMNRRYGLPSTYQGVEIVVENAPIVTSRPKDDGTEATTTRRCIKSDDSAIMLSRPGGIDGDYGAPSFSTVQIYHHGPLMKVQEFDDARNERVDGHVVEQFKEVIAAPVSGFLIQGIK